MASLMAIVEQLANMKTLWYPICDLTSVQVTGLRANTNNRASTVLGVFMQAIQDYGTPSRMRGDRGGENTAISVWMIMHQGPNRASFMWGS
jgi:hypothetical protein